MKWVMIEDSELPPGLQKKAIRQGKSNRWMFPEKDIEKTDPRIVKWNKHPVFHRPGHPLNGKRVILGVVSGIGDCEFTNDGIVRIEPSKEKEKTVSIEVTNGHV